MSINIKGNFPTTSKPIQVRNTEPRYEYASVPVTVHGHVNRDTDAKRIAKYLKDGWNWNLWVPIAIAEFPSDSGIEPKLLDGDHRRHMFQKSHPDRRYIPAMVYQVKDMEEYHDLFTKINLYNRKSATKEEVFVHDVLSMCKDALATKGELIKCGLSVHGSSDPGGIIGLIPSPCVKIGGFRKALKQGSDNTKAAAALIKKTWPQKALNGTGEEIKVELLEGLAILYNLYPILRSTQSQISQDFERWFISEKGLYPQAQVATDNKRAAGAVVNKAAPCVAKGILQSFRKVNLPRGSSIGNKARSLPLSKINNIIDG